MGKAWTRDTFGVGWGEGTARDKVREERKLMEETMLNFMMIKLVTLELKREL